MKHTSWSASSVQLLLLFRMDDMAVDSDEEVDYSKMDQVWSWDGGLGFWVVTL